MPEDIETNTKSFEIKGCVAFVTGTNKKQGIGRAIVDALVQGGAEKVYATARNASQLDELVESSNGKVVAVALDVTDKDAILELGEKYSDVNLVVNNAGLPFAGDPLTCVPEGAMKEMEVNYIGPLRIVQSFANSLKKDQRNDDGSCGAALVNVNSITSFLGNPFCYTYGCSKAAAHLLTEAHRSTLGDNTFVMGLYPGPIDTDMMAEADMVKFTPASVASAVLEGLKEGREHVFPDPGSKSMINNWLDETTADLKQK